MEDGRLKVTRGNFAIVSNTKKWGSCLLDYGILTFDKESSNKRIMNFLRIPYTSPTAYAYETDTGKSGRRDWIAEFEARMSKELQYGNLLGYQNRAKVLSVLKQLVQE